MSNEAMPERMTLLKRLTVIFSESDCTEFEYQSAAFNLTLKRDVSNGAARPEPAHALAHSATMAAGESVPRSSGAGMADQCRRETVLSGMTGVFFRAASPGKAPFVTAGDQVTSGQTLGLIEAMKMLNTIESDLAGTVVEVLQQDGAEVTAGTPLFMIEVADV